MTGISRREFLKLSGVAAGAAIAKHLGLLDSNPAVAQNIHPLKKDKEKKSPVYQSIDFLRGYFENKNYPTLIGGKPWINSTTNIHEYNSQIGGVTLWDFFTYEIPFGDERIQYQDDNGNWHPYIREKIRNVKGQEFDAFLLADRIGPGVVDKIYFTHDGAPTINTQTSRKEELSDELTVWGNLHKLANLRIEVDNNIVFDGPIRDWFSGKALDLPSELVNILFWKFGDYGSTGSIIPLPYQNRLKIFVYGGEQPKWFTITGMKLSETTQVKSFIGDKNDLPQGVLVNQVQNITNPEKYIDTIGRQENYILNLTNSDRVAAINLQGKGTIAGIQFRVPKDYDIKKLHLRVKYAGETGMDLPLIAFFTDHNMVSLHHSTPIGVIEEEDNYLFYSNLPFPYQNGIDLELSTNGQEVSVPVKFSTLSETSNTQLKIYYDQGKKMQIDGPDYQINIRGNGKIVGIVLVSDDQQYELVNADAVKKQISTKGLVWPMGYMESNFSLTDGLGTTKIYDGLEDWADGGFYFNSGYTLPPGGSNRPFGGILRYKEGKDGYATIFRYFNDASAFEFHSGVKLNFQHGTVGNNFPVRYASTIFYYSVV